MSHATSDPHRVPHSRSHRRPDRHRLRLIDGGADGDLLDDPGTGRHALDEDALLTPIFAAVARRTGRRPARPDPVERFRRDPLTAPLPVVVPARRRPGAHAAPAVPLPDRPAHGRHALRATTPAPAHFPH
jgi:hypothetical protein